MTEFKCCTRRDQCLTPGGPNLPATLEYFNKDKKGKYGVNSLCHACRNAYARAYAQRPEIKELNKERCRKYKQTPKGKEAVKRARQKPENIEKHRARYMTPEGRERRRLHAAKSHVQEWIKEYSKRPENQAVARIHKQNRRAKARNLPRNFTKAHWQYALEYFHHSCAVCGKKPDMWVTLATDHWIPLRYSGKDNPGTVLTNIVPLCHARANAPKGQPSCNPSKSARMPREWLITTFGEKQAEEILSRINQYFRDAEDHFFGDSFSSPQLSFFEQFA